MVKSILEFIKKAKDILLIATVVVGIITGTYIKEWLLKEQNARISKIEKEVLIIKKVACGILDIAIMQARMTSILSIQGQENIEIEKERQRQVLDATIESLKEIKNLCSEK